MEASAAAATSSAITSLDDTTQEYVQEVPLESRTPHPDGGEVPGEVGVFALNENDADVHALMSNTLPKYVIIQSNLNHVYLHLYKKNPAVPYALRYTGDYSFDLDTRFEVVPSTTVTGLVHIRCLKNNKYWANFGTGNNWVAAMAVKPEENQSDKHCTLFQAVFRYSNNNHVLKLRHVSSGKYARLFYGGAGHYDHCLSLMSNNDEDWCTFIDWESVVVLPDLIRIKGDNGNHLRAFPGGAMDYNHKADNSSLFDYQVYPSRNGGIRLKSAYYGNYWTYMDNSWVWLQDPSSTVHDINTVFLPTLIDGNHIIMRCLKNNKFCNRYTADDRRTNSLAARLTYPDEWSSMEIEEPVISRNITKVKYHLTDARLYNEKNVALITDAMTNKLPDPITSSLNLQTTVSNTTSWSTSTSFKVGVKVSLTFGVPFIESGGLEISAEGTHSSNWGETTTKTSEKGIVKTITVPPMSRVKGSLKATRLSYDIPFSYIQYDVLKNGSTKVSKKKDGLFTGHNGYGYSFEIDNLPFE